MTTEELKPILEAHHKWLLGESDGMCDDLSGDDLSGDDLSGDDLSGVRGLPKTVPLVENLNTKILSAIEDGGKLEMHTWHTCETTHCRAGWTIILAGSCGCLLEELLGPDVAASLITHASCPWMERVPDWFATNAGALADIRACAAKEAA
jgi:hypothetical protein